VSARSPWKLFSVLAFAASLAGAVGLGGALRPIAANRYLQEGLQALALFDLRDSLNRWLFAGILVAALIFLALRFVVAPVLLGRGPTADSAAAAPVLPAPRRAIVIPFAASSLACFALAAVFFLGWGHGLIPSLFPRVRHLHAIQRVTAMVTGVSAAAGLTLGAALCYMVRAWFRADRAQAAGAALHRAVHSRLALAGGSAAVGAALGLNGGLAAWQSLAVSQGPNVLLISVDTLRADHLGCYGAARDTSPNMDALARRGVLFERAYAQAPWTLPSMASVVSSLYPSEHSADAFNRRIPLDVTTLAERLRSRLYRTTGIVAHHFTGRELGFSQGFEAFDETHILGAEGVSSPELTQAAIRSLEANRRASFFLWVHYFDPHYSYVSHEEFPWSRGYTGPLPKILKVVQFSHEKRELSEADVQYIRDVYDEEVSFTDRHIGELLRALDRLGLSESTLVVLVGDHGEEFLDRGNFGHGSRVYEELAHVPLIIAGPGVGTGGRRAAQVVETRSIATTVSSACGLGDGGFSGMDLLAAAANDAPGVAFIEGSHAWGIADRKFGVVSSQWKLIESVDSRRFELYDLKTDPGEVKDLFGSPDPVAAAASRELAEKLSAFHRMKRRDGEQATLNPETEEQLRSLGYLK